ncbi:hypothetical protein E2C01_001107 [Portunus trituberculatus]|uniref:Uncharacterized protein n=1 Tax=Portunus trituberculatus TaxID=210409 RepID=A0A5B7CGS5_PORTR|nr:hypothetical protein [Portunus trituberculatus]
MEGKKKKRTRTGKTLGWGGKQKEGKRSDGREGNQEGEGDGMGNKASDGREGREPAGEGRGYKNKWGWGGVGWGGAGRGGVGVP